MDDYGMKRYVLHIYIYIFVAWTITYLAQRVARKMEACASPMPYAHNVSHSRRNFMEFPDSLEKKNGQNSAM